MAWRTLFFIIAAAVAASGDAAIFGADDRMRIVATENSPFAAVGRINARQNSGSGFLVSECHVLSAKHIIDDRNSVLGREVRFKVQLRSGEIVASYGKVIANGGFDIAAQQKNPVIDRSDDWMLIRLDDCLGRRLGYLELAEVHVTNTEEAIRSAGYPQGELGQLVIDPSCRIYFQHNAELMHDCATQPGNSGGPVFRHVVTGGREKLIVLGMHTSGEHWREPKPFNPAYANRATKISFLAAAIRAHVGEQKELAEMGNGLSRTTTSGAAPAMMAR